MPIQPVPLTPFRVASPLGRGHAPYVELSPDGISDDDASCALSTYASCTPSILRDAREAPELGPLTLMDLPKPGSVLSNSSRTAPRTGSYPWSNLGELSTEDDVDYARYQMASRPYFLVKQGSMGVGHCAHAVLQDIWRFGQPLNHVFPLIEAAPSSVALFYVNPFTERKEMLGYAIDLFGRPGYRVLTRALIAVPAHNGPGTDLPTLTSMVLAAACFHMGSMVKRDLAVAQVLLQGIAPALRAQALRRAYTLVQAHDLWTLRPYFMDREEIPYAVEYEPPLRRRAWVSPLHGPLTHMATTLLWGAQRPLQAVATCLFALPKHWAYQRRTPPQPCDERLGDSIG